MNRVALALSSLYVISSPPEERVTLAYLMSNGPMIQHYDHSIYSTLLTSPTLTLNTDPNPNPNPDPKLTIGFGSSIKTPEKPCFHACMVSTCRLWVMCDRSKPKRYLEGGKSFCSCSCFSHFSLITCSLSSCDLYWFKCAVQFCNAI